jgi:hypothetical protein
MGRVCSTNGEIRDTDMVLVGKARKKYAKKT